jgi:hypothetical protein
MTFFFPKILNVWTSDTTPMTFVELLTPSVLPDRDQRLGWRLWAVLGSGHLVQVDR